MAYPRTRDKSFPLAGGYDLINDMRYKAPGSLIAGNNIQIISGKNGYSRVDGIERCAGDLLASNATPIYLSVPDNTIAISLGAVGTFFGGSVVCLSKITETGAQVIPVVCSDQSETLYSVGVITFPNGDITVDSVVSAETNFSNSEIGTIRGLAKDYYLDFVSPVPGENPINGGFRLHGTNYVFRDGLLHRGVGNSWETVSMPDVMHFDSGVSALSVGEVITDGTATGTIASITRQYGSWNSTYEESEQSYGYFTLTDVTGSFSVGSDLTVLGDSVPSIVNGDFATDTDWTSPAECVISGGSATVSAHTEDGTIYQPYVLNDGDVVEFTIVLSGVTAGAIKPVLDSDSGLADDGAEIIEDGTHVVLVAATKDITTIGLTYDIDFIGDIESISVAIGRKAKVKTVNETYSINTGGNYKTAEFNFTNLVNGSSMFGVSGVNHAFEFDGTNYIPILYPDTDKYPIDLMIHQRRLHLCFPGGEKPFSVNSDPRVFNSLLGAGSDSTGAEITGCVSIHGNAALVNCDKERWFLYGDGTYDDESSTRNWQFFRAIDNAGGEEGSLVGGGLILFVSGGAVYKVTSNDTTSGYSFTDVSEMFAPILTDKIGNASCAVWVDSKKQYRVFFDDGTGICVSFRGGSIIGATPIEYPVKITNIWKSIENDKEQIFFTSSNSGYLYRMDSGDSMDGDYISGSMRLPFHGYDYDRYEKEYPQLIISLSAPVLVSEETEIKYTVNFDNGTPKSPLALVQTATDIEGAGGVYGANAGFGNFVWSGVLVSEIFAYIDGYGENMSILVAFKTKNDLTFAFQSVSVDYIIHGRKGRG